MLKRKNEIAKRKKGNFTKSRRRKTEKTQREKGIWVSTKGIERDEKLLKGKKKIRKRKSKSFLSFLSILIN